jgi:hypothetical protein
MLDREESVRRGHALPDGSFPIETERDLHNAIQAIGRAKDYERAKRHIIKRAREMGKTSVLPDAWNVTASAFDRDIVRSLENELATLRAAGSISEYEENLTLSVIASARRSYVMGDESSV